MRKDLGMRAGKMVAQGVHASLAVVLENQDDSRVVEWLADNSTTICVRVESEKALLSVHQAAQRAGLLTALINDLGRTEFKGAITRTCVAVGPDTPGKLAPVTGELKPL